jgi:hypothetical protein
MERAQGRLRTEARTRQKQAIVTTVLAATIVTLMGGEVTRRRLRSRAHACD